MLIFLLVLVLYMILYHLFQTRTYLDTFQCYLLLSEGGISVSFLGV